MVVIFFEHNFNFVKDYTSSNSDSVAFWYSQGLSSYSSLQQVISIEKILIEASLKDILLQEYHNLFANTIYEVFDTAEPINTSLMPYFFASNDTHIHLFRNVLEEINDNHKVKVYYREGENAQSAANTLNIPLEGTDEACKKDMTLAGVLVLGNDWGLKERDLSYTFLCKNINTVCVQESSIDLNPKEERMRNCSFPIFQGVNSLQNYDLGGVICAVIGNPRFENLKPTPFPNTKQVFINVNFTYGIFEEKREGWVNDILGVCSKLNTDYVISQHPRDAGVFTGLNLLKSHPGIVHKTISDSTVVISRFSALLLEAICLGRPAIYYNPHGEDVFYKFEPDNKCLFYARNQDELEHILEEIFSVEYQFYATEMLSFHLGNTVEGKSALYIKRLLNCLNGQIVLKKPSVIQVSIVLLKKLKKLMLG